MFDIRHYQNLLSSVFKFSKLCGVSPFRDDFTLSPVLIFYSIILVGFNLIALLYSEEFMRSIENTINFNTTKLLGIVYTKIYLVVFVAAAILIVESPFKGKALGQLRNQIQSLHYALKLTKHPVKYNLRDFLKLNLLKGVTMVLFVFTNMPWNRKWSSVYELYFQCIANVPIFIFYALQSEFITFLAVVHGMLDHIYQVDQGVAYLILVYNDIAAFCHNLEKVYSFRNLIITIGLAVTLPSTVHFIIVWHFDENPGPKSTLAILRSYSWIYVTCIFLIDLVTSSKSTEDKAKQFTSVLYNIMMEDKSKTLVNNEKLQLHLIMKREIKFTACGFFPLDYSLIHSMIAAATTYLIILAQFGSDYSKN